MNISFGFKWFYGDKKKQPIESNLLLLLSAIEKSGSLKKATEIIGVSYRHAWGLIKKWENEFGVELVKLERGRNRGATLTPLGMKLTRVAESMDERFDAEYQALGNEVSLTLRDQITLAKSRSLNISASRCQAVTLFEQLLKKRTDLPVNVEAKDCLDGLRAFAQTKDCSIAGFHYPVANNLDEFPEASPLNSSNHQDFIEMLASIYRPLLESDQYQFLLMNSREQGIITISGKSQSIKNMSDLTHNEIRFINRGSKSGTRIILDNLLALANIDEKNIDGFNNEEFTHEAVAAMIATGMATAGFGIKAVASQFNLDFIPVLREAYLLVINKDIPTNIKVLLREVLVSSDYQKMVNDLPGYDAENAGEMLDIKELLKRQCLVAAN